VTDYAQALARRNLRLPAPDGYLQLGPWWKLADGGCVRARPGQVDIGFGFENPDAIEADALAQLAAVAWARAGAGGAR
jgi:hypothetical protein